MCWPSLLGLLLKRGIKESIQDALEKAMGLAIFLVGLSGALQNMFSIDENGALQTNGGLVLVLSLAVGTLLGEMLDIDDKMNRFGIYIEQKLHFEQFSKGFVGASLLFCTGAMAIIGPITEVLTGDMSVQLVKAGWMRPSPLSWLLPWALAWRFRGRWYFCTRGHLHCWGYALAARLTRSF